MKLRQAQLPFQQAQLPKGWEMKKLGEVCDELFAGGDVPKDNYSKAKSDVHNFPIYSNGEKNKGLYGFTNVIRVNKPSITISARGTIGYSEIRKENYYPAIRLIVVIPRIEILDLFFLNYVISSIDFTHSGSSIPQLTVPMIKEYPIPVPPLPEQKRIVAILDKAFVAIAKAKANAEQNLKNAKELFESYLQGVFDPSTRSGQGGEGWEEKTLGEVCKVMNGGTPDTTVPKFWGGENLWITPKDMGKLESIFVDDTFRKITDEGLKNSSAKILPSNSIILSSRAPIGHLAINTKPISTNQGCKGLVPKKNISALYIYYFLLKSVDLLNSLGSGTTFKELSGSKLSEVIIPIPKTLKEQQSIVKSFNALSAETKKLEAIYQQKINDLEELKKSILQKAFNGELKTK